MMKNFNKYLILTLTIASCGVPNIPVPTNHCVTYTSNNKTYVSCSDGSLTEVGSTDVEDSNPTIKVIIGKVTKDTCKNRGFSVVVFEDDNGNNSIDPEEKIIDTLVICHKKHEHKEHDDHREHRGDHGHH